MSDLLELTKRIGDLEIKVLQSEALLKKFLSDIVPKLIGRIKEVEAVTKNGYIANSGTRGAPDPSPPVEIPKTLANTEFPEYAGPRTIDRRGAMPPVAANETGLQWTEPPAPEKRKRQPTTYSNYVKVRELAAQGMIPKDISKKLDIPWATVSGYLDDTKWTPEVIAKKKAEEERDQASSARMETVNVSHTPVHTSPDATAPAGEVIVGTAPPSSSDPVNDLLAQAAAVLGTPAMDLPEDDGEFF